VVSNLYFIEWEFFRIIPLSADCGISVGALYVGALHICWLGIVKISNFFDSSVREVLGCAPIMILILFYTVNIFLLYEEFPQRIIP